MPTRTSGLARYQRIGCDCPANSQIGIAELFTWPGEGGSGLTTVGVYNITHGTDTPARFGFNYGKVVGLVTAGVEPDDNGEYTITSGSFSISQAQLVERVRVTLWGVPADPSHDSLRQSPPAIKIDVGANTPQPKALWQHLQIEPAAFLTAPPRCSADPLRFKIRGDSWENQDKFDEYTVSADKDGTPFQMEGCDRVPFNPSAGLETQLHSTANPTGLGIDITVPQPKDAYAIGSAHVRKVRMTFPKRCRLTPPRPRGSVPAP